MKIIRWLKLRILRWAMKLGLDAGYGMENRGSTGSVMALPSAAREPEFNLTDIVRLS